jgi:hypothetical protein
VFGDKVGKEKPGSDAEGPAGHDRCVGLPHGWHNKR